MKKTDINQLISAYYDNELTDSELDLLLEETKRDPDLLAKLNNYALISAISEKEDKLVSIFENISDFVQKRWVGNGLTAAAAVLLTVMFILILLNLDFLSQTLLTLKLGMLSKVMRLQKLSA